MLGVMVPDIVYDLFQCFYFTLRSLEKVYFSTFLNIFMWIFIVAWEKQLTFTRAPGTFLLTFYS